MEKLKILNIENNLYKLIDKNKKEYEFNLTFYDLTEELQAGNYIYLNKELLNPNYIEYSNTYFFGSLEEQYGREIQTKDDIDLMKVKIKDKTIYLKRFFG